MVCSRFSVFRIMRRDGGNTNCSFAMSFMPSNRTPVTLVFRYRLAGAPCGVASAGTTKPESGGCCDVAREPASGFAEPVLRIGVPVRGGSGDDEDVPAVGGWAGDCAAAAAAAEGDIGCGWARN